jgi:ABC-type sugar transport system permease subunit
VSSTAVAPGVGARHAGRASRRRVDPLPYLLVAPTVLLILAFTIAPAVYAFIMSLYKVEFIQLTTFVGVQNYVNALTDPLTRTNFLVTGKFVGAALIGTVVAAFGLALILNQPLAGRSVFRTAIMIPWVTTQVVSTLLVKWMLDFQFGFVNQLLRALGMVPISFLGNANYAMASLVGITIWRSAAYGMVLLLAGLQTIPSELYEAAEVDGANALRRFWSITMPLIRGPLLIMVVMESMGLVSLLTPILVLTGGGPADATEVLALRLFRDAFTNFNMGAGATIAMLIFALDIVLSLLYIRLLRTKVSW